MKSYTCPVCGFDGLDEPPYDEYNIGSYNICSCCGFEYGNDDDVMVNEKLLEVPEAHELYRIRWVKEGAIVFDPSDYPSEYQINNKVSKDQLIKQLKNIHVNLNEIL
ncbi:hypothetical protein P4478_23220 [Bacillus subtilis]|nr:hypothetical protein [Bacillus subtilis]